MSTFEKDPLGHAIHDYQKGIVKNDIIVHSDICEDDILPVDWLFRTFEEMPEIEQKALELCKGKILDIGSGTGCHSLQLAKENKDVTSIDISKEAIQYQINQGINAINCDFFEIKTANYDTLLLLMNGIGICGTLERLPIFLKHAHKLLNQNGQILCDSTDISYMFEEEDGSLWVDLNTTYKGNFKFQMEYNTTLGDWFDWLYVDKETLTQIAEKEGFSTKILLENNGAFLAQLTKL